MSRRTSFVVVLVALFAATLAIGRPAIHAQTPPAGDHTAHLKAWDTHKAMAQSSPYKAMNCRFGAASQPQARCVKGRLEGTPDRAYVNASRSA